MKSGRWTLVLLWNRRYGSAPMAQMLGMDQPFGFHRNLEQAVFQIRE